jgi:hypothetical protein
MTSNPHRLFISGQRRGIALAAFEMAAEPADCEAQPIDCEKITLQASV